MNLRRGGRPLLIGHKGAAALEPENTLGSLSRAVELGCDLVEFDVLSMDGRLVLGHSPEELPDERASIDDALALLAESGVGAQVDLKWHGYEAEIVDAIARHGLVDRALVSTCHARSLRAIAALEPRVARGITYPYDRSGVSQRRALAPLTKTALATLAALLPLRINRLLSGAEASAAVLHYSVVSRAAVAKAHARGAAVLAWTVDDVPALERVLAAGVDGVITNDPGLLSQYTASP
ncbi:MAG TPA: glycerophosphodiester phosphodiesterase [Gaiellaceae bacterium]|nr:glycerophosphodiester phosphodiesterase [Gaiellaceae bacterium]